MRIKLFHSGHDPLSHRLVEALTGAVVVDAFDPNNAEAMTDAQVYAVPCVVVLREDQSLLAQFNGTQLGTDEMLKLTSSQDQPLIDAPFVLVAPHVPFRVFARHPQADYKGPVLLTVNGETVPAQTVEHNVDASNPEAPTVDRIETPAHYEAGEAALDLEFSEPGVYRVSAGGAAVLITVAATPVSEPDQEPPTQ